MKVYAQHEKIQAFLKEQKLAGIEIVDEYTECNFLISGQFKEHNYHENLKGIIIPYTGHNGVDLDVLRKHHLMLFVTTTRSKYVAEKAVALTLGLLGKVAHYDSLLREGNWAEKNSDSRVPWDSIQGKNIGIYGYGRIGKIIHKMLKGFDCQFATIDRGKDVPDEMEVVKNLTNLVQISDIIIIAAPLNDTTEGAFDRSLLSQMKHKYLINVGRGKIVEENSLYEALKNKKLQGYASDVWYNYPKEKELAYPSNYPIYELDNVLLSNHSGGYTVNTNEEVNQDLLLTLFKIARGNFEDQLDLKHLI